MTEVRCWKCRAIMKPTDEINKIGERLYLCTRLGCNGADSIPLEIEITE